MAKTAKSKKISTKKASAKKASAKKVSTKNTSSKTIVNSLEEIFNLNIEDYEIKLYKDGTTTTRMTCKDNYHNKITENVKVLKVSALGSKTMGDDSLRYRIRVKFALNKLPEQKREIIIQKVLFFKEEKNYTKTIKFFEKYN